MNHRRLSVALLVLWMVAAMQPLSAQVTETGSETVSPITTDAFLLTPAAPSATRTVIVDAAEKMIVKVSALSEQVTVTLISPNSTRYQIGTADTPAFESVITTHQEAGGANHSAILYAPTPGTWQLEVVHATPLTSDVDVYVSTVLVSPVVVALVSSDTVYPIGGDATVALAAFDGTTRLQNVTVTATVIRPDGTTSALSFRDDGVAPDTTPNDGIRGANVSLLQGGEYTITARVTGTASSGAFERKSALILEVVPRTVRLDGTFTNTTVDKEGDGLIDEIRVAPRADVLEAATYTVSVRLVSSNGKIMQRAATMSLGVGLASPIVTFPADEMIRDLGVDGPYVVRAVYVDRHVNGELVPADRRASLGSTSVYRLQDFHRDGVVAFLSINPATVIGGENSTGTVTLTSAAPAGGAVVALSSSNTAAATVPASVTVRAGVKTATFTVQTLGVSASTAATIAATAGGRTRTAVVTAAPSVLRSLTLDPQSVPDGTAVTGLANFDGEVPSGAVVNLSSSTPRSPPCLPA